MLFVLASPALADATSPPIPDTPAGHALGAYLDAFNSGDRGRVESFANAHAPWIHVDEEMDTRARTGGYELVSIEGSGKLWMGFQVKERAGQTRLSATLVVKPDNLEHLSLLGFWAIDPNFTEIELDEAHRGRVIAETAKLIEQYYVFPDVAKTIAGKLKALQKRGEYRGITDGGIFEIRVSDDLKAMSGDKHFRLRYFAKDAPPDPGPNARPQSDPKSLAAANCGFEKAEHLSPNIGYLKLNFLAEPEFCAPTAIAAMNFLADSDALIIDLRENWGGSPPMAVLLGSYLFEEPAHLGDDYDRGKDATEQRWTYAYVPGKKFIGKPVYLLTSKRTFSSAELFSFALKNLKRATLVGEASGGGAHPVAPHRIDDHFFIGVPFGRFMDPVTKLDWEGTGVQPDINVPAADALEEALRHARGGQ
ncbi:MAG TPA: S41 family peptidase [Steroidobacteraceae bacterium]|nr:S41 family peptidase [Steroidobacteraceae bacterium]